MKYTSYLDEYLNYLSYMKVAEETQKNYIHNITRFFERCDIDVEELTKADVNKFFMNWLEEDGHKYSGLKLMKSSMCSFYRVVCDELGLTNNNPMVGVKLPSARRIDDDKKTKHHMAFSKQDVLALIHNAKNVRDRAVIAMLFQTGMRFVELSNITLEMYLNRDEEGCIHLTRTKGNKERNIYLSDTVVDYIEKYLPTRKNGSEWLFTSNTGVQLDRQSTSRMLKVTAKRAEFEEYKVKEISNHCMRASLASHLLNETDTPVMAVASTLGNSSDVCLRHYYNKSEIKTCNVMKNVI